MQISRGRRFAGVLIAIGMSLPVTAAEYVFGSKGGVYCSTEAGIDGVIVQLALSDSALNRLLTECGLVAPGAVGRLEGIQRGDKGLVKGRVSMPGIRSGAPVFFISNEDPISSSPPRAAETPAPAAGRVAAPTSPTRRYKVVEDADLRNTPSRWADRDIELRNVNVYWVADDDVRFATDVNLVVFSRNVTTEDREYFREACETQREALTNKCRANIRFSYTNYGADNPTGVMKRVVIRTSDITALRRPSR